MIGYIAYLALLIFPGLAAMLVLGELKGRSAVEVVAVSFGLSLIIVPLLLFGLYAIVHTVSETMVYGVAGGSVLIALASTRVRKIRIQSPKIDNFTLAAIVLTIFQGAVLLAEFSKYPIFPLTTSQDFRIHLQSALQFQAGTFSISGLTYPPGAQLLIASLLAVEGGNPISNMQYSIVAVASIAPLLFYVVASKILKSQKIGLLATLLYVLSGAVWYTALFASGLYPNFVADIITVVVIYLVSEAATSLNLQTRILITVAGVSLYFTHYTTILFIASLWLVLPVVWFWARDQFSRFAEVAGLVSLPGVLLLAVRPDLLSVVLNLVGFTGAGAGIVIATPDFVSTFLSSFNQFLYYLYVEIGIGLLIFTIFSVGVATYFAVRKKNIWLAFLVIWFALVFALSPQTGIAWRFAKYGVLPILFIWGLGFKGILPNLLTEDGQSNAPQVRTKRRASGRFTPGRLVVILVIFGLLLFKAPINGMATDLAVSPGPISQNADQVYDAMNWLGTHGGTNTNILGIDDWRFSYMTPIWGDSISLYKDAPAEAAYQLAAVNRSAFLIVGNFLVPGPLSSIVGSNNYSAAYQSYPAFTLIYSNPAVSVYKTNLTA